MSTRTKALENILSFLQAIPEGDESKDGTPSMEMGDGNPLEELKDAADGEGVRGGHEPMMAKLAVKPEKVGPTAEVDLDSAEHDHDMPGKCGSDCPVKMAVMKKLGRA